MSTLKKYNVAFISNGLVIGGAERFFINVVNGLHERGYKPLVILLTNKNPLIKELHDGIDIKIMSRRFRYDISVSWRIKKIIEEKAINKVFCVETFPFILGKLAFYNTPNTTFYLSLHNSLPISFKQNLFDILYLSVFRKTDIALFICQFQRICFSKFYRFKPQRFHIIYNGIDTNRYYWPPKTTDHIDHQSWKTSLGLSPKDKTILMVGRISIEKGHKHAIQALKFLHNNNVAKAHLIIVGSGDAGLMAKLEKQVQDLELINFVHFVGAYSDVRPFLFGASLFTLTSFSETFSLAALEAMACGLPVSLTNVGGATEMVPDESIGLLSEKNDPENIAKSWELILAGNYSKEKISDYIRKNFSLENMISEYEKVVRV